MWGFLALARCGIAYFDTRKAAAGVDLIHQVEAAHIGFDDRGAGHRARIVDHDVDAAEGFHGALDRGLHLRLVAHIHDKRQGLAAGAGDLLGGGEDRTRQLGMRLFGLGGDRDVGAVARRSQRDGKPDAARRAGDEECCAL